MGVPASELRKKKENLNIGKKEVKKSLFSKDIMICVENLMDFKNKKLISIFSNPAGKVDWNAKLIIFLYWQQTSRYNICEVHRNKSSKRYEKLVHWKLQSSSESS